MFAVFVVAPLLHGFLHGVVGLPRPGQQDARQCGCWEEELLARNSAAAFRNSNAAGFIFMRSRTMCGSKRPKSDLRGENRQAVVGKRREPNADRLFLTTLFDNDGRSDARKLGIHPKHK